MDTTANNQSLKIALPEKIKLFKSSFLYKCAGLLSSLVILSLPLVYGSLVLVAAILVSVHIKSNSSLLTNLPDLNDASNYVLLIQWRVLLFFTPIVCGILLVIFMLKPFFKGGCKTSKMSLSTEKEAALYAYIRRLCKLLNATEPATIEVECNTNAMAGFLNGWRGFFTGRLVLSIGLPLVRGLTISQLTGVLIHEIGHFRQTFGMKLSFLATYILAWFKFQVYSRDHFDSTLVDLSKSYGNVAVISLAAMLLTNLTRAILWGFYQVGSFVGNLSSRQLEYGADSVSIAMLGTRQFKDLMFQTCVLSDAEATARYALGKIWDQGGYCINIPDLIVAIGERFSDEYVSQLSERIDNEKPTLSSYHLTAKQRFDHANKPSMEAQLIDNRQATILFSDFNRLSESITKQYYKQCGVRLEGKRPVTPGHAIEMAFFAGDG